MNKKFWLSGVLILILGFLLFLISENKNVRENKPLTPTKPTVILSRGTLTLWAPQGGNIVRGDSLSLIIQADSANEKILGYDLDISYDHKILKFNRLENLIPEKIDTYTNVEKNLFITGIKKTDYSLPISFDQTPIVKLYFTGLTTGKSQIAMKFAPDKMSDSNLVNENSRDILDKTNNLTINVGENISLIKDKKIIYKNVILILKDLSTRQENCADCLTYAKVEVVKGNDKKELLFKLGGIAGLKNDNFTIFNYTIAFQKIEGEKVILNIYEN